MSKTNLDALIPREDFTIEIETTQAGGLADKLKVSELIKGQGFFYSALRKPDFQRETSDWDKDKVASFIKSFLDGDLIPAIILWQAGQYIFVIDGAHRLSALIAWVNDDYGDGFISQSFFNHDIDSEQKRAADITRKYVNKLVGSYKEYIDSIQQPEKANTEKLAIANKLGFISLQLQWVTGSSEKAASSFFTINQKATPISDTEISLLKSRNKPHALASRAIIRSGGGHKYWKKFNKEAQEKIQNLAKELNEYLFTPEISNPVKTLDLPLAGKGYSSNSLSLVYDFVRLANNTLDSEEPEDDSTGESTIQYLERTAKIVRRFTTTHPSSLGLHPAVYFYSEKGRYQPTSFLAWVEIIKKLEKENTFKKFTDSRRKVENFLIRNKNITNQVTLKYGSGLKGYKQLRDIYLDVFNLISTGNEEDEIKKIFKIKYPYINFEYHGDEPSSSSFTDSTKSEVFITSALKTASTCAICGGLIHLKSLSIDHIQRKQDGGIGTSSNGQLAHLYCNTSYKN